MKAQQARLVFVTPPTKQAVYNHNIHHSKTNSLFTNEDDVQYATKVGQRYYNSNTNRDRKANPKAFDA